MLQPQTYETTSRADFYAILERENRNGDVVLLDSQLQSHPSSGKSILFAGFDAIFRWKQHSGDMQHPENARQTGDPQQPGDSQQSAPAQPSADRHQPDDSQDSTGDPWKALARFREKFPGYCCGYLGYDLKNARERLHSSNPDETDLPDIWMGRPTRMYILNEPKDVTATAGVCENDSVSISGEPYQTSPCHVRNLRTRVTPQQYMEHVRRAQHYIREGDCYEVNLSHQLQAEFEGSPLGLFTAMYQRGPVPFAAYLQLGDTSVCCASPERFLTRHGSQLQSDPIKGTRPRGNTAAEDQAILRELLDSEKERAENLMIVDLVRNDFSRVCQAGSVRVDRLFDIQSFATVHQMVSRVEGRLESDIPVEEIIAACFPMGSMTGAPKIRAMEIIEELESYRRGLYSGAIGVITPEGDFSFNVVIRTAIIRQGMLYYAVGGAITADSDPAAEWEETLVKSRALGTGINIFQPV